MRSNALTRLVKRLALLDGAVLGQELVELLRRQEVADVVAAARGLRQLGRLLPRLLHFQGARLVLPRAALRTSEIKS